MRISNNSVFNKYASAIQDIQYRKNLEEMRISSGKQIQTIAESPKKLINIKQLGNMVNRNEQYLNNIDEVLSEVQVVSEQLDTMGNTMQNIRQLSIDATQTGCTGGSLKSIAGYVKGLMDDIIRSSNEDFNGHYVFAGTKTNEDSMNGHQPFEIIEDPNADASNPSKIKVVFYGNYEDRVVHKDTASDEVVNFKADELFGENGSKVFDSIIKLYNTLQFNSSGQVRSEADILTKDEQALINQYQKEIGAAAQQINVVSGRNGGLINRLELVKEQLSNENIRLKEFRSIDEDTDYASSAIKLKKEETTLAYALQVGANILQQSLFDFLK